MFTNKQVNELSKERESQINQLANNDTHINMCVCMYVLLFRVYVPSQSSRWVFKKSTSGEFWDQEEERRLGVGVDPKASCHCGRQIGVFAQRTCTHAHSGLQKSCADSLRLVYAYGSYKKFSKIESAPLLY